MANGKFGFTVRLEGWEQVRQRLRRYGLRADAAFAAALYQEMEAVMARSKQIVPVDTGALRASGHVKPPVKKRGEWEVTAGYGNSAVNYAVFVHERLDLVHNPPTRAKYLEEPLQQAAPTMAIRIARKIDRAMK